jgi:dTDP-4-amino-4,6-dideoxygalactose transaminase
MFSRDSLYQKLKDAGIYARRYFYPLISNMPMYRGLSSAAATNLPMATKVAEQVLCLPIFPALKTTEQDLVIEIIRGD